MSSFSAEQIKELSALFSDVLQKRDNAAVAAATAAAAASAATGGGGGTINSTPPPLNPVTASPDALHAAATGNATPAAPAAPPLGVNPLAGKPAYVRFPSVSQAVMLAIMSHKLGFKDLVKLDVSYSCVSTEPVLSLMDGRLTYDTKVTSKHFSSPAMMLNCFSVYFDILTYHVGATLGFEASFTVSHGWHLLERRILQFAATYKWHAVVSFLEEYYCKRVAEMLDGRYSGWWDADSNLESFWLAGNLLPSPGTASLTSVRSAKASSASDAPSLLRKEAAKAAKSEQVCYAYIAGVCTSPCRNGRKHEKPAST